jgi:hypothetical protein
MKFLLKICARMEGISRESNGRIKETLNKKDKGCKRKSYRQRGRKDNL